MKWITKQYRNRFAPKVIDGKQIYFPHLYLTYCFMNLTGGIVYKALGRDTFLDLFSWYYENGVDEWLLFGSVVVFVLRVKYRQMEELPSE